MLLRLTILCAWLCVFTTGARAVSPLEFKRAITAGTHESLSGQFIVHDAPPVFGYLVDVDRLTNLVRLDPTLLAVSIERIKSAVLEQLGTHDQWRDHIAINLHHIQGNEPITITPLRFDRDWLYRVDVPDAVERPQLVSAIAEVVLLEIANRSTAKSVELPAWFVQGLAREIQCTAQYELVIDPPKRVGGADPFRYVFNSGRRADPLAQAHEELRTVPPLTLEQLSWPGDWKFTGDAALAYGCSAQLFYHDLLNLPNGRAAMRAFLGELPQHLNWQISFLTAFHNNFASQRELEKWWALDVVQFTGRDLTQTWPSAESWNKLDQVLRQSVEIRSNLKDQPLRNQVSLATIIHDWDAAHQKPVLREKSQQLAILRARVSQDLVYLVDDYRRVIDSYLNKKDFGVYIPLGKTLTPPALDNIARNALQQLAVLEARREQLRPKAAPAVAVITR
ncbi:MAG TPA: hypothetical protein VH413_15730 [Verrucomicrobiae bacterium]|jgi:hypothetical protein|nr:hypothetical protein [Verrucomicrobiae bacterium]